MRLTHPRPSSTGRSGNSTRELLEKHARARRAEQQLADIGPRRETLQRQANEAAENGDTEAILAAERDLALLPALEDRLAEQHDVANAAVIDAATRAAEAEVAADEARWSATDLRRWADADALAPTPPALPEHDQKARERQRTTVWQETDARETALRLIRELPNPDDRDAALAVLARECEARRAERAASLLAGDIEMLDNLARLAGHVVEVAAAQAFQCQHAPLESRHRYAGPMATSEREQLDAAVSAYRARLGRDLPRCRRLASAEEFGVVEGRLLPDRFAAEVAEAANAAEAELDEERTVLDTSFDATRREAGTTVSRG